MLGRYIIDTWREDESVCLINFGRSKCPRCHVNVKGDLRDADHVERTPVGLQIIAPCAHFNY